MVSCKFDKIEVKIWDEQRLCYDCVCKLGIGEFYTHCDEQWVCDKCIQKGHSLKPVDQCPWLASDN